MASNSDLVDWCDGRIGRWAYVFGGSRTDPDSTGGTDCSGMVCAAFADVFGVQPCELGDWTGAQWASDATSVVWWGTEYGRIPWDDMERGDIVFTSNCSPDFSTGNGSHVGFFTGTGDCGWEFCSMFGTPGPQYTRANGVYGNECYFGVKRYEPGLRAESEEDVSASDVWEYPIGQDATSGKGNVPAWQRLSWIHHDSAANYSALRGGYNGPAGTVQSGASIADRICYIDTYCGQLVAQVAALSEAVKTLAKSNGADPDAIAEAVDRAVRDKLASIKVSVDG